MKRNRIGRTTLDVTEIGFGAFPLGNFFRQIDDMQANAVLERAWAHDIRYFDTAPLYGSGLSEQRLGAWLQTKPRREFVVSTKVGRSVSEAAQGGSSTERSVICDYSYDGVMSSFENSLQRLGLDRVDILLVHEIGASKNGDRHEALFREMMEGGYRALDELRRAGVITAIGLGVSEWQVCEQAMDHGVFDCFLLAGRYTLLEQDALDSFLPRCIREQASVIICAPFNSGILATGAVTGALYDYRAPDQGTITRVDALEDICRAHGVNLAAAALGFPLLHPAVASVIPGMAAPAEVEQNMRLYGEEIAPELWRDLKLAGLLRMEAPVVCSNFSLDRSRSENDRL